MKPASEQILLGQLEEVADKLGVGIRCEKINVEESNSLGGLCRVQGEYIIIIDSRATIKEKIQVLAEALRHFDLEGIYIKPKIRQLLEGG